MFVMMEMLRVAMFFIIRISKLALFKNVAIKKISIKPKNVGNCWRKTMSVIHMANDSGESKLNLSKIQNLYINYVQNKTMNAKITKLTWQVKCYL